MRGVSHKGALAGTLLLAPLFVFAVSAAAASPGALDPSFGMNGKVLTQIRPGSTDDEIDALAQQPDGKIVAAGYTYDGTVNNYALARYSPDGSLDPTFGSEGKVAPASPDQNWLNGIAVQPDGKIVGVGRSTLSGNALFGVVRLQEDGSLDPSFGTGGEVQTPVVAGYSSASDAVVLPSGKIVVAGYGYDGAPSRAILVRYKANGSLDTSFGTGGIVKTSFGGKYASADGLVLQPDGKLVVSGYTSFGTGNKYEIAVARYNANGSLDTSFGTGGKVRINAGTRDYSAAYRLALQPDGRIVVGGRAYVAVNQSDFAVVRLDVNGSLDSSFGTGGTALVSFGGTYQGADQVVVQPNGKIVAAGYSRDTTAGGHYEFALARLRPNGSLDPDFGTGGRVTSDLSIDDNYAEAAILQPSGKIVAGGAANSSTTASQYDFALARYQGDSHTLTIKITGNAPGRVETDYGNVDCRHTCTADFADASTARLLALPPADTGVAAAWAQCPHLDSPYCDVEMNSDKTIAARFMRCVVPKLKGRKLKGAKKLLRRHGCTTGNVKKKHSSKVKKGRVLAQKPKAGAKKPYGYRVRVTLSKGP